MPTIILNRPPATIRAGCLTGVGYNTHMAHKEMSCEPCRLGNVEKMRKFRLTHTPDLEKKKIASARYYSENKAKVKARHALWYLKNKESSNAATVAWMKANPEFVRKHGRLRRARKRNALSEPYTTQQILDLYGIDCHICHKPIDLEAPRSARKKGWEFGLHLDHVIPLSKGGTDLIPNIRPSHVRCNLRKNDSHIIGVKVVQFVKTI